MQTKRCGRCKKSYLLSEFNKNRSHKSGLYCYCKKCSVQYYRNWRRENPEKVKQLNINRHARCRQMIHDLKLNGCAICSYNKSRRSLHFHHTNPEDKKFGINLYFIEKHSGQKFANEVNKCILVCANCHGEIHDL